MPEDTADRRYGGTAVVKEAEEAETNNEADMTVQFYRRCIYRLFTYRLFRPFRYLPPSDSEPGHTPSGRCQ